MTRKTGQSSDLYTDAINLLLVTFILFYCLQGSSTIVPWASGAGQGLLTICWKWKYETNRRATFPLLFFGSFIATCSISQHRFQQVSESKVLSPKLLFLARKIHVIRINPCLFHIVTSSLDLEKTKPETMGLFLVFIKYQELSWFKISRANFSLKASFNKYFMFLFRII